MERFPHTSEKKRQVKFENGSYNVDFKPKFSSWKVWRSCKFDVRVVTFITTFDGYNAPEGKKSLREIRVFESVPAEGDYFHLSEVKAIGFTRFARDGSKAADRFYTVWVMKDGTWKYFAFSSGPYILRSEDKSDFNLDIVILDR